jgi:hypothetical protein
MLTRALAPPRSLSQKKRFAFLVFLFVSHQIQYGNIEHTPQAVKYYKFLLDYNVLHAPEGR